MKLTKDEINNLHKLCDSLDANSINDATPHNIKNFGGCVEFNYNSDGSVGFKLQSNINPKNITIAQGKQLANTLLDAYKYAVEWVKKNNGKKESEMQFNDSIKDGSDYIYLFPLDQMTSKDKLYMIKYNLKVLGKNIFGRERNLVVKGSKRNLEKYCDEYMGYEMHPDYLYKEDDFAGEIRK